MLHKTTLGDEIRLFNSHLDFYRSLIEEKNMLVSNPPETMTPERIEKRLVVLKTLLEKERSKLLKEESQIEKAHTDEGYHAVPIESPTFLQPRTAPK